MVVAAPLTTAQLRTANSSVETLAVIFDTTSFAAITATRMQELCILGFDFLVLRFESEWVLVDCFLEDKLAQFGEQLAIATLSALATRTANTPIRKTGTVQFQTIGLAASAVGRSRTHFLVASSFGFGLFGR